MGDKRPDWVTVNALRSYFDGEHRNTRSRGKAVVCLSVDGYEYAPVTQVLYDGSAYRPGCLILEIDKDSEIAEALAADSARVTNIAEASNRLRIAAAQLADQADRLDESLEAELDDAKETDEG